MEVLEPKMRMLGRATLAVPDQYEQKPWTSTFWMKRSSLNATPDDLSWIW